MGERVAVKPGSAFERTNSQKRQLALQTENSTVGISLFQGMTSSDSAMLGGDGSPGGQSEEELSSVAYAGQQQQAGGGEGLYSSGQGTSGSGQDSAGGGQQHESKQGGADTQTGDEVDMLDLHYISAKCGCQYLNLNHDVLI